MVRMTNTYKGKLSPEDRAEIDHYVFKEKESVRSVAEYTGLPYGQVRGYVEWRAESLPDLIDPPPADQPAILIFDVETTPSKGFFFGKKWKTNILQVTEEWYMLSAAYKWFGQDEIGFFSIYDDPKFEPGTTDDRYVVDRMHRLLDQADIVIAHNGDNFDTKVCNTRFAHYRLGPPSPYQSIDTLKEDRRYFKRESHSLKDLAKSMGLTDKLDTSGIQLWFDCMDGVGSAWLEMETYNRQDVGTLEELYLALRPWIGAPGKKHHPNLGHWSSSEEPVCPNCAATHMNVRGWYRTGVSEYPVLQCMTCGSYHRSRIRARQRTDADRVHVV